MKLQVDVQAKYSGYLKRQSEEIDRQQRHEETARCRTTSTTPQVGGLSNEARQSLASVRPQTLGQAARIPGLTPAALSLLLVLSQEARSRRLNLAAPTPANSGG